MPWPIKHGMYGSKEYISWIEIKRRCLNKNSKDYKRYGAKGIIMDPDFVYSFESFFKEVGLAPSTNHSIDRIDNTKGYIKGNLKWSTIGQQSVNKSNSYIVTINGVIYDSFAAAGKALNVSDVLIHNYCKGYFDKRVNRFYPPKDGYSYKLRYKKSHDNS